MLLCIISRELGYCAFVNVSLILMHRVHFAASVGCGRNIYCNTTSATCYKVFIYDVIVGRYEWPPSAYKHFYFNSTHSMLAVWLVVVTGIILLYECVRYIIPLVYYSRCLLRHEMLALFVSSLYPHYYGWWGLINYINEDFYA